MKQEHPDANLLAAFAEKRLLPHERKDLLAHLAECPECREVVALASAPAQPIPMRPMSPVWRWAAGIAAAALVLTGAWGLRLMLRSPQESNATPLVAMTPKADTLSSPAVKSPPPAEIAPAPPAPRATPPARKVLKVLPPPPDGTLSSPEFKSPPLPPVEIAPPPPPLVTPPARKPLKAFPPSPEPAPPVMAQKYYAAPLAKGLAVAGNKAFLPRSSVLWRVTAPAVERSVNRGATWRPVSVSEGADFRAVASDGSDVWAGGSHAALFHSSDQGSTWLRITVRQGAEALTGTIVAIRLPGPSKIILETAAGEQWISRDAGTSWTRL